MEEKQGIKARAKIHREHQSTIDKELAEVKAMGHLDDTNYIEINNEVLEENKKIQSTEVNINEYDVKSKYNKNSTKRKSGFKKLLIIMLFIIAIVGVVAAVLYKERYGLSDEVMDVKEYYGTSELEEQEYRDMFIMLNNEQLDDVYIVDGAMYYLPYDLVNNKLNAKIYWDYKENLLLYSGATSTETIKLDEADSEDYTYAVAIQQDDTLYVSMEYIEMRTNLEWYVYENPNRLVINNNYDEYTVVDVTKNTQLRYRGGVKSEILVELETGTSVELLELGLEWHKVATEDGFVGYVPVGSTGEPTSKKREEKIKEEVYDRTLVDYKIALGWHQTTNLTSNNNFNVVVEGTKNTITTIAPTWFFIDDTLGNITSLASQDYVDAAHKMGIDVWATLNDFDGAINSQVETYYALNSTSKRAWIIEQVMDEVLEYGIDGINVDIELVSSDAGNHFVQFLRELSIECRANGIVLSVDNYPAEAYNSHYEWDEQADVVDYIVIMGYDEYYGGSKQAGPVSSITYVENGITEMLKYITSDRLINAIPFYSRLWEETPKTESELESEAGSEDSQYLTKVTSASYGMEGAKAKAAQAGAVNSWDFYTKHNFASWTEGESTFKIWFEDTDAVREKLTVMEKYDLAGVAAWKLGIETLDTWDVIQSYLDK